MKQHLAPNPMKRRFLNIYYIWFLVLFMPLNETTGKSINSKTYFWGKQLQVNNAIELPSDFNRSNNDHASKVRIGLKLSIYRPKKQSVHGPVMAISQILRHTLRAQLLQANHFYFDRFHIETKPLKWNKTSQRYRVNLTVYSRFGPKGEVEEKLGELSLQGVLKGQNGLYVLHGIGHRIFKNKFGKPLLGIAAGYKLAKARDKIARK